MANKYLLQEDLGIWFNLEFLEKNNISQNFLADKINVKSAVISKVVHGRLRFSPALDLKLSLV